MAAERTPLSEVPQPPVILKSGDEQVEIHIGEVFTMMPWSSSVPDRWRIAEVTDEVFRFSSGRESRVVYMTPVETGPLDEYWYEKKVAENGTVLYRTLEMDVASSILASKKKSAA